LETCARKGAQYGLVGTFEMIFASEIADAIGIVAKGGERRARDGGRLSGRRAARSKTRVR
jgi:hypothetical protein